MARDDHGLPNVSPGPAMPNLSKPCGQATHEMALQPFLRWLACRVVSLRPSSTPSDTPRCTPLKTNMNLPSFINRLIIFSFCFCNFYSPNKTNYAIAVGSTPSFKSMALFTKCKCCLIYYLILCSFSCFLVAPPPTGRASLSFDRSFICGVHKKTLM
jgi:hypothetical protein